VQRDIVLTTRRMQLTSWLLDDVDPLLEVHTDPETMRFVRNGRPESRSEIEQLLGQYIAEHDDRGWTKWRLIDRAGRLIGRAGFGGTLEHRGLSYTVRRSHWGRGLATEIADALVGWHLAHAVDVPLRALVMVGNDASARVLEKVGFDEVGPYDDEGIACRGFVYPGTSAAG
jgi:ribosomal-protein-alanine N-acetyltransferase